MLRSTCPGSLITNVPRRGYVFAEPVGVDNETVIERHLFERVEIEETDGTATLDLPPPSRASRRRLLYFSTLAGVAVLLASGAFLSFRTGRDAAIIPPSAREVKAVSSPSKLKLISVLPFESSSGNFGAGFANELSIRLGSKNKFSVRPIALVDEYAKHEADFGSDFVWKAMFGRTAIVRRGRPSERCAHSHRDLVGHLRVRQHHSAAGRDRE